MSGGSRRTGRLSSQTDATVVCRRVLTPSITCNLKTIFQTELNIALIVRQSELPVNISIPDFSSNKAQELAHKLLLIRTRARECLVAGYSLLRDRAGDAGFLNSIGKSKGTHNYERA